MDKNRVTPDMILQSVGLSTGTAWDNYDELTETLSGKNTLHDTVGICYQNKVTVHHAVSTEEPLAQESPQERPAKRRRQYEPPEKIIVPYKRKPSISSFTFQTYTVAPPSNLK